MYQSYTISMQERRNKRRNYNRWYFTVQYRTVRKHILGTYKLDDGAKSERAILCFRHVIWTNSKDFVTMTHFSFTKSGGSRDLGLLRVSLIQTKPPTSGERTDMIAGVRFGLCAYITVCRGSECIFYFRLSVCMYSMFSNYAGPARRTLCLLPPQPFLFYRACSSFICSGT
jgi:hypothetical protein